MKKYKHVKVIVFGGSGFLGSHLVNRLDADEMAYFSLDRGNTITRKDARWISGDVTDYSKVAEAMKDADVAIFAVEDWNADEKRNREILLAGIKNVVNAVKANNTDQKVVSFSIINQPSYPLEFFRTKRLVEDNTRVLKSGLVVRLSFLFGEGDHFTDRFRKLSEKIGHLSPEGNLAPVYVDDVVTVVNSILKREGVYDICSNDNLPLIKIVNYIRKMNGKKEIGETKLEKAISAVMDTGLFTEYESHLLFQDYYRETNILDRYVKEPLSYLDFLRGISVTHTT
ncbi:MAG: NAD(P)-dependent oxidoreductase [Thermoplasma sp.]|nr:MAG: NAD(P)-dependent oxidoreductase [Thermoplasma sp.]